MGEGHPIIEHKVKRALYSYLPDNWSVQRERGGGVILYTGLSYIQVNTVLCFCVIFSFKEKQWILTGNISCTNSLSCAQWRATAHFITVAVFIAVVTNAVSLLKKILHSCLLSQSILLFLWPFFSQSLLYAFLLVLFNMVLTFPVVVYTIISFKCNLCP